MLTILDTIGLIGCIIFVCPYLLSMLLDYVVYPNSPELEENIEWWWKNHQDVCQVLVAGYVFLSIYGIAWYVINSLC